MPLSYVHVAFMRRPLQKPQLASPVSQGKCRAERPALSKRWENILERSSSGMWNTAVLCLSQRGRTVDWHLDIKMQLNCITDLNTEMVPALKNKASLNSQMRKCVWTQITAYLKKKICEDTKILMHCQLLQRRLYSLDTFWCHKMHPTVKSFAEKKPCLFSSAVFLVWFL